jgi:hypothetical protein
MEDAVEVVHHLWRLEREVKDLMAVRPELILDFIIAEVVEALTQLEVMAILLVNPEMEEMVLHIQPSADHLAVVVAEVATVELEVVDWAEVELEMEVVLLQTV